MKHLKYIIWILLVVLSAACEQLPFTEVTLKKQTVEVFDNNSVVLEVEFNPTAVVIQSVVVYYSTNSDMSHTEGCAMECNDTLAYKVKLTNLQKNTTYYVRYEVTNPVSAWVVTAAPFSTKTSSATPDDGTENGHEYVDLGLSVKWATCNVGATKPEEYGDYFAWGETQSKNDFSWDNYKYYNASLNALTKYNNKSSYGTVDYKITLDLSDDAARFNWGGVCRMPTDAEWTELRKQCTWTWITQNGVKGYRVTGTNGNSIFFPTAGYRRTSDLVNAGSSGYYWSSSLDPDDPNDAYELGFNSGYVGRVGISRYYGHSVRPVYGAQVAAPTVVTSTVTQIEETTAVAGGNVTSDGGASVTERGVVYSTSSNPTTANSKVASGSGTGAFTCNLTNLQPNTTYYVRAYASNDAGIAYGEQVSFTTKEEVVATPEYVDLGLSVKWATFNVGATKPEEYGDYFAWGETESKDSYNWSTYKWCNGSSTTLTKYCTSSSYGSVDNKTTLDLSDDAAVVNWGGNWRMPTDSEMTELREQCIWTWITQNGVKGYIVTSKSNGNSIFLPAAGYREGSSFIIDGSSNGEHGHYWSSSVDGFLAYRLYFYKGSVKRGSNGRCYGQSVRPVCP